MDVRSISHDARGTLSARRLRGTPAQSSIIGFPGLLGVGGGLLVLVAVAASSAWQAERNSVALERSAQTQALRTLVSDVLIDAQNAEAGQRGFLLTQNNDYLVPFERARVRLPGLIDKLVAQLSDVPALLQQSQDLRQAVRDKTVELQQTVDLTAAGQLDAAFAMVRTNRGREAMARIRGHVGAIAARLDAMLLVEAEAIRTGGRRLVAIDFAALVLVVILASLIAIGARAYLADLALARWAAADAYRTLQANNERLDETVRRRTADLTAANDEIQRFAYIVSHDLRAPLVNIMGFTGELEHATHVLASYAVERSEPAGVERSEPAGVERGEPAVELPGRHGGDVPSTVREAASQDIPEALRFIKASTSKMDRLINAILKLSREGQRLLTPEPLDMRGIFATLVQTMGHQALSVEIVVDPVPDIVGDRIAVEQVFGNIIDNALKYLDAKRQGRITVTGSIEDAMARYDVADNGRGIDQRDFERVFELFRRAGNQSVPGEGIGLAYVRALVRRMGGSIVCNSAVDVGTIFTVRLPVVGHDTSRIP